MLGPRAWARFRRNRGALLGLLLVVGVSGFALMAPFFTAHDPYLSHFGSAMTPQGEPVGPNSTFLLGADRLFRDQLSRLAHGARLSLFIAIFATIVSSAIGATVGITAGWSHESSGFRVPYGAAVGLAAALGGVFLGHLPWAWAGLALSAAVSGAALRSRSAALRAGFWIDLDNLLMRVVDVGLSFPYLLLVMAIGAALDRITPWSILVTLGLTGWLGTARIMRAKTLEVRSLDYVVASRALGQTTARTILKHVLPNVAGPLLVIASMSVANMIIAESVLSYLGVGISPPTPTWGHMLFEGQDVYLTAPWLLAAPALAILVAVFGFNLLGEGLRDALDPHED